MRRLYLSAALAALLSAPAYGQTLEGASRQYSKNCDNAYKGQPEDTVIICDYWTNNTGIVVTASRTGFVRVDQLTAPATIIGPDEIKARNAATVANLLRTVPGASVNRSGPVGGLTQLRLRGTEGNHVLVLVDGIEVSNPNTGEFDFASLRSEDVIRIEVLRGEQSALWGSDAVGGVVNISTRAGNTGEAWRLSVEGGSFGTLEGQVSAVVPIGGAALSINGNVFTTNGYDVSGLGGEKDGAESQSLNIGLNNVELGAIDFSGKFSTSHAVSEFDSDTNFDSRLNNTDSELETNTNTGRVSARFEVAGFDNLVNISLTDTKQNTTGTSFQNDTTGKRTQANWAAKKSWSNHDLTVLGETEKESFSNFGGVGAGQNQDESISNHALAGDYRYSQNAVTLTASARHDFNDRFKNSSTWRVGAGYAFENFGGRVRASVGTGIKNPSMTELFGFFPGSFVGNAALIPERSLGYDIGYDQEIGGFNFSIDYFHSDLEDEILTIFNPNFTSTVANTTTGSKRQGVELEMRGRLNDVLSVRGSATFLDTSENGVQEVRRPEFLASGTLTWSPTEELSLTLSADHTGNQTDLDFSTFPASRPTLDAFTLVGLNVQYALSDIVTLSLRGDNLLDTTYQEVISYASQGRGVYAGISTSF